jgi:DNA polymerase III epsilon subunit family exonuclease
VIVTLGATTDRTVVRSEPSHRSVKPSVRTPNVTGMGKAARRSLGPAGLSRVDHPALDSLGPTLAELTFVVIDLETSGASPDGDAITEIAAVKVRGGETIGELATLVDPGHTIADPVVDLTGITDSMVRGAPRINEVLPSLLEFVAGGVVVAHNAGFDVGFLQAACSRHGYEWPPVPILDTLSLARRVLARDDDVPDCRLATLADVFHARTTPSHRALDDARATVDVLHGLFERVGTEGVTTFDELASYTARVSGVQRRKQHLADAVPPLPAVYLLRDHAGRVVGTGWAADAHGELRRRVSSPSLPRRLLDELAAAEHVDVVPVSPSLAGRVMEARLRADHGLGPRRSPFGHDGSDPTGRERLRAGRRVIAIDVAPDDVEATASTDGPCVVVAGIAYGRLVDARLVADAAVDETVEELRSAPASRQRASTTELDLLLSWLDRDSVVLLPGPDDSPDLSPTRSPD